MRKWFAVITVAGIAAGISACEDSADADNGQKVAATPATPSVEQPLKKEIGQHAGLYCPQGGGQDSCAVNFKVTAIEPATCATNDEYLSATKRVIRVSVDAEVLRPVPEDSHPGLFLISQNWMTKTPDGYIQKADTIYCGDSLDSGPFGDVIRPGDKSRGQQEFAIPKDATTLILRPTGTGGWQWDIPAT